MAPRSALAGLGNRDGDVVAGVGGVRGELGIQDLGRVGNGAQLGRTGRHVVVYASFAVATHQGDADADVRIGVRFYLYDVRVLDHGVGTDRSDRAGHGGVDGGARRRADVDGAGLATLPCPRFFRPHAGPRIFTPSAPGPARAGLPPRWPPGSPALPAAP